MTSRTTGSSLLREDSCPGGSVELLSAALRDGGDGADDESSNSPGQALEPRRQARTLAPSGAARGSCRAAAARCYMVYCIVCLSVTGAVLLGTLWAGYLPPRDYHRWKRTLRPWEEAGETFVGAALCAETLGPLKMLGWRLFIRDRWRILDFAVAALTLLCGFFFLFRRSHPQLDDVLEDVDGPMLLLRFGLQPVRMLSTASMVVRARQRQRTEELELSRMPTVEDPRRPAAVESVLTPELASEIRELLPAYLRFVEWELVYCPRVHGTSLQTFYRAQAGPNVIVARDAHGGLLGGFAAEPWRPERGAYGSGEAFVFARREVVSESPCAGPAPPVRLEPQEDAQGDHCFYALDRSGPSDSDGGGAATPPPPPRSQLQVFWAVPQRGRVVQWSDAKMLGLGRAFVVCEDFLRGSSHNCEAFHSPPLSAAGDEFIIRDFECWRVGDDSGW